VTVGQDKDDGSGKWPYAGTAEAVQKMNAKHFNKNVDISFTIISEQIFIHSLII